MHSTILIYRSTIDSQRPGDCDGPGHPAHVNRNLSQNPKREAIGNPTLSQKARKDGPPGYLVFREGIGEGFGVGFFDHPRIVVTEEFL
jgi:hypothetical protein